MPTAFQMALGILVIEKTLIEYFHDFGVICSYDKVLRFKLSAAITAAKHSALTGICDSVIGLIQAVAGVDGNISSQNGL